MPIDDLDHLERKYSVLPTSPQSIRDAVANSRREELRAGIVGLEEQRKYYSSVVSAAPLAARYELLHQMQDMKVSATNYVTIFEKYLGEYPELMSAVHEYDEQVAEFLRVCQEAIERPYRGEVIREEAAKFVERSVSRPRIITVKDIIVSYEHRYDSIQALRGIVTPSSIQEKITEVLTANPDADLRELENALGIKVISVQRKGRTTSSGIIIGSGE